MQIKTWCYSIYFLILFSICDQYCYAQDIKVYSNSVDSLVTNNSENLVYDVNGDICSLVILTTELKGLKFYSNLGVEKIANIDNGYKIWIQNKSKIIKIIIPDFPLFEYNLPQSDYEYSVYIISLIAKKSENIIIKDTIPASLSISTSPTKARIFLNEKYLGKSPIIIKKPDFEKFDYLIKKKGYEVHHSTDSIDKKVKDISIELKELFHTKRYFFILNTKWDQSFQSQVDAHGMPGITFGVFGKTGMYGSLNMRFIKEDLITGSSRERYPDFYKYSIGNKISIVTGLTQQLGRPVFVYGGLGYINRTYHRAGYESKESSSPILNTGFVFRIGWYSLLQIDYSKNLNNRFSSIGIGYGFNLRKTQIVNME